MIADLWAGADALWRANVALTSAVDMFHMGDQTNPECLDRAEERRLEAFDQIREADTRTGSASAF